MASKLGVLLLTEDYAFTRRRQHALWTRGAVQALMVRPFSLNCTFILSVFHALVWISKGFFNQWVSNESSCLNPLFKIFLASFFSIVLVSLFQMLEFYNASAVIVPLVYYGLVTSTRA